MRTTRLRLHPPTVFSQPTGGGFEKVRRRRGIRSNLFRDSTRSVRNENSEYLIGRTRILKRSKRGEKSFGEREGEDRVKLAKNRKFYRISQLLEIPRTIGTIYGIRLQSE